jgi:membrane protease YdiL (CAAX protease family)
MSSTSPPAAWPRDAFRPFPTIMFALGAVAVAIVSLLVFFMLALGSGHLDTVHPRRVSVMIQLVGELAIYIPVGIYLLALLPLLAKRSLRDLGIRAPGWREIGIGLAGAILMTLAVDMAGLLMVTLTHRHDTEAAIALLKQIKTPAQQYLFVSIAVVFAPLLEELGFRVFLFNALTRFAPVPVAVVLSGLIFGTVHGTSLAQLLTIAVPLATGGIVLAFVYAWARNYWSSVITHAAFNALPVTMYFVFHVKT